MSMSPLPILNDYEYYAEIKRSIRATKAGDRIAMMVMSFDPSEPITAGILRELIAATKRQVHVQLNIDAHSLMVHDVTALPMGPLYTRLDPIPKWRYDFSSKLTILNTLRENGGDYCVTNIPEKPFSNPFSGRSHIKFTVINDTAYIGGCNLNKTWGMDLMVRLEGKKTVDWIYKFIRSVGQNSNTASVLAGKDISLTIDKNTMMLVDAGKQHQSLIYQEALDLIDQAKKWIVLTCQFFPGKTTAEHVFAAQKRGVNVTIHFGPVSNRARALRLLYWYAEQQERRKYPAGLFQNRLDPGLPRLHAKLLATEQAAMIGSHNYFAPSVALGTAEATILRRDPSFAKAAVKKFADRLTEASERR